MIVNETADRFVYEVESESNPEKSYRVDLESNPMDVTEVPFFAGRCECADWLARCSPALKQGILRRCKHIRAAREYALNVELNKFAAKGGA